MSAPQSFASSSSLTRDSSSASTDAAPVAPATANAGTNTGTRGSPMPYVLTAVGHSLGGAELLMYTVTKLRRREPHRLARLVLLTPAGFVAKVPMLVRPVAWALPAAIWFFRRFTRDGLCAPFIIPTTWARTLVFGLGADVKAVPELDYLLRCACRSCCLRPPAVRHRDVAQTLPPQCARSIATSDRIDFAWCKNSKAPRARAGRSSARS